MEVRVTPRLNQVLVEAAERTSLPRELRKQAAHLSMHSSLPWDSIKKLTLDLREHGMAVPPLQELCKFEDVLYQGHSIAIPRPPKQPSPELLARRQQLQARLENLAYESMVSDITADERKAEEMRGFLPTTHAQLSYGAHVLVIMFTLFMLGYTGSKYYGSDELWAGLFGALGLTLGLLVEVLLLIIRETKRSENAPAQEQPAATAAGHRAQHKPAAFALHSGSASQAVLASSDGCSRAQGGAPGHSSGHAGSVRAVAANHLSSEEGCAGGTGDSSNTQVEHSSLSIGACVSGVSRGMGDGGLPAGEGGHGDEGRRAGSREEAQSECQGGGSRTCCISESALRARHKCGQPTGSSQSESQPQHKDTGRGAVSADSMQTSTCGALHAGYKGAKHA